MVLAPISLRDCARHAIILGGLIPLGLAIWLKGTGFVAIGLGLLVTLFILFVAKKNLGGITGDVLGMIIEVVETLSLLVFAVRL